MSRAGGVYGGRSAEARRSERRGRLLAAALDLIGTEGWSATSVRRICQRARLSSRFFYESFDNLDALAVAVVDGIAGEAIGSLVPALAGGGELNERIEAGVGALVGILTDDPRKARVAFVEALGSEPVMRRRLAIMQAISELLIDEFRRIEPGIEDERFVRLAAFGLTGLVVELMIAWTHGQVSLTPDELAADVTDLVLGNISGAIAVAHRRAGARR